ncbi:type VI secretion system baseplate subunit TssG [Chelativorans sp. AA-79]|uniref:type VI secretion system baseplate subunit TssG n=1 Tax=Chelativorans sp. AA-79 TaxID=3028735 RepID=UPI0023F9E041|nr:type VI secretion system baseplate subunit TssG [Chelativorans sp. AA-79]WEX10869.1 type VI secretion system baseplate subunit TssG [Chelativorans sp. AA-79]
MSYRKDLREEPHRFDFFAVLREFERSEPNKPRIGDSKVPAEDILRLGQDPFLEFPASNLSAYEDRPGGPARIKTRFLGFFGPQGALPLTTTIEAYTWATQHDPSFARFTDIIANRFQQLFYRAWADARPISQHERPDADRFFAYVGSMAGIGSEPFRNRDTVRDIAKVSFAGLAGGQVKSAARLRQMLEAMFEVGIEVVERIGSWLIFEPGDRLALGTMGSTLGQDTFLGSRAYSINDKIRIRIAAKNLEQYRKFLPGGNLSDQLADLVFFYIGHRFDFDVELALRAEHAPAVELGRSGELGWTSWIAPAKPERGETVYYRDARFSPLEMRRSSGRKPKKNRTAAETTGGESGERHQP